MISSLVLKSVTLATAPFVGPDELSVLELFLDLFACKLNSSRALPAELILWIKCSNESMDSEKSEYWKLKSVVMPRKHHSPGQEQGMTRALGAGLPRQVPASQHLRHLRGQWSRSVPEKITIEGSESMYLGQVLHLGLVAGDITIGAHGCGLQNKQRVLECFASSTPCVTSSGRPEK